MLHCPMNLEDQRLRVLHEHVLDLSGCMFLCSHETHLPMTPDSQRSDDGSKQECNQESKRRGVSEHVWPEMEQ